MSEVRSSDGYDQIWSDFLTRVSTMVTKQTLDTWFRPMRLAAIMEDRVEIECPNKFFMDWVDEHHKDKIHYVMAEVLEFEPSSIRFSSAGVGPDEFLSRRPRTARPVAPPRRHRRRDGRFPAGAWF